MDLYRILGSAEYIVQGLQFLPIITVRERTTKKTKKNKKKQHKTKMAGQNRTPVRAREKLAQRFP